MPKTSHARKSPHFRHFMKRVLARGVLDRDGQLDITTFHLLPAILQRQLDEAENGDLRVLERAQIGQVSLGFPWDDQPTSEILHMLTHLLDDRWAQEPVRLSLAKKMVATLRERRLRAEQRGQDWE